MEKIDLPMKPADKIAKKDTEAFEMTKWPFLDPHRIIEFLYNKCKIEIPKEDVKQYWELSRRNREPWATASEATSSHVPLGIYGDAATIVMKYGAKESITAIFLNLVLWRPRSVRMSRFLVCALPDDRMHSHHTLNEILRRACWSLNSLYDNKHPVVGVGGSQLPPHLQKLAGGSITRVGACFTVTEIRGDWQWLKKIFRFPGWNAHEMCHHCPARSEGNHALRYYNFDDASWIQSPFSTVEFLSKALPATGVCTLIAVLKAYFEVFVLEAVYV